MYFPTNWGAKEPQNLPNHRVAKWECHIQVLYYPPGIFDSLCKKSLPAQGRGRPPWVNRIFPIATCSMYGIFTYIYHTFRPNAGKYAIH